MITKEQIEAILKINGIPIESNDEQIRTVLLNARFTPEEAETAIGVLHNKISDQRTRIDGLHKVFRTDTTLKPNEISSLLGIEIEVPEGHLVVHKTHKLKGWHFIVVWFVSVVFAVTGILFYMYLNQVGLFHPSMGINGI